MPEAEPGPKPSVLISNRQALPVDEQGLAALARETLVGEGVVDAELSVSFVADPEIEELHVRYLNETGPTDVLSFPMDGPLDGPSGGRSGDVGVRLLGDVVIAPAVAERNAPVDPSGELRRLLVHGILHLLGYDHEEEAEKAEMWSRQEHYSGLASP